MSIYREKEIANSSLNHLKGEGIGCVILAIVGALMTSPLWAPYVFRAENHPKNNSPR
jgi:hypothetical protein